ncbi:sensor histidine kinase [Paenibacillus tarimensis]
MKIRTKLILSMSILIVFIMLCLLAVTHIQFYIYRDFAYFEEKALFESLREEFEQYFADHDESWEGVHTENFENIRHFTEIVLIADGNVIYQQGQLSVGDLRDSGYIMPLYADDRKVGRLYVMNEKQYKTFEFKLMWYEILPNIAKASLFLTLIAALAIVFFLSWRLTRPIRKILRGIDEIKSGETGGVSLPVHRKDEFGAISRALQQMNESLANLERSRKQLLSDVAHELKTPLMIIQGELELAQDSEISLSQAKLSSLLDEVLRLTRLVHDVLDLSKLEAGTAELRPKTENIVAIVEGLVEKIQFLMEDKHIRLSMIIPENVIDVPAEKHRIVQALYNILVNAVHYTHQGGQVQLHVERVVHVERQNEYVRIKIEDTGVGIPVEDLPYIFNRFYRADHSRTRPSGGTGLGLAIAQQNILAHQGWIDVQSATGKGSVFSIYLPLSSESVHS